MDDLFDLEALQQLQDAFAQATHVASIVALPDGTLLTKPSNFCRLCATVVGGKRGTTHGCQLSGMASAEPDTTGPRVGACVGCGLWQASASIHFGGRHVASWIIGQVRGPEPKTDDELSRYADELGVDRQEFAAAYQEVGVMTREQFGHVADALFLMASQFSEQLRQRLQLARSLGETQEVVQRLRVSEERYRRAMDAIHDAVWDLDVEHDRCFVSTGYYRMLGYEEKDGGIRMEDWLALVHPDDIPVCKQALEKHRRGETDFYEVEYRMKHRDGRWLWIRSRGKALIRSSDGTALRMVGTNTDITQHRQATETEIRSAQQLQRAQRFESLGVMAGGIAHDFNNHLMSIMGNLELAELEVEQDCLARSFLSEAMNSAQRTAELCHQMLSYAGRTPMRVASVDLTRILRDTSSLMRAVAGGHAVIDIAVPNTFPKVRADPLEIRQVVMNLVTNAVEACEGMDGRVTVSAHTAWCQPRPLEDSFLGAPLEHGWYATVRVSDSGCGMAKETLERAFEPFFTTKFQGRGLGLAAALGICRAHGGTIVLKSAEGKGTTAEIVLPLAAGEKAPAGERPSGSGRNDEDWQGHGTVLIVDDERPVLEVAAKMLGRAGFEVVKADSGSAALSLFEAKHGDLAGVLLDWAIPDIGGTRLLAEIREIDATIPIVLTSGYSETELEAVLADERLSGIVHKPFSYVRLREAMRAATAERQ